MASPGEEAQQHEEWLAEIGMQLAPIFENSQDGVYVYLDDHHKICNEQLATMWGFKSAADWAKVPDFLGEFIATDEDRAKMAEHYHRHIHQQMTPARFRFWVKGADGNTAEYETDMVPFAFAGQLFAYHFVRPVTSGKKS